MVCCKGENDDSRDKKQECNNHRREAIHAGWRATAASVKPANQPKSAHESGTGSRVRLSCEHVGIARAPWGIRLVA
jgi:hypothetical protein